MANSQVFGRRQWGLPAIILALLLGGGAWLLTGRLAWLETSNYADPLYGSNGVWLTAKSGIKQDFIANYPGLSQVDVFVAASNSTNKPGEIFFHLQQTCDGGTDLRQASTTGVSGAIDGHTFYTFSFPPIEASAQQKFCFILETPPAGDEQEKVEVLVSQFDVYPEGRIFYAPPPLVNSPNPGLSNPELKHKAYLPLLQKGKVAYQKLDVGFQLHYQGQPLATFQAFLTRLAAYKPGLLGNGDFYVLMFIIYIGGLFLLIRLFGPFKRQSRDGIFQQSVQSRR